MDWVSDENVMAMDVIQEGVYIRLICVCWMQGSIPADIKQCLKLLKAPVQHPSSEQETIPYDLSFINVCFVPHPTESARLIHPRLEKERQKQDVNRIKRQSAGRKGGLQSVENKRKAKQCLDSASSKSQAKSTLSSSTSSSSTSLKDKKTMSEKEKFALVWEQKFEEIWKPYPEKKGKEKAKGHFKAQVLTFEDFKNIQVALENYKVETARVRASSHPDRAWMHGGTWFKFNWKDFIDYQPPEDTKEKTWSDKYEEKNATT